MRKIYLIPLAVIVLVVVASAQIFRSGGGTASKTVFTGFAGGQTFTTGQTLYFGFNQPSSGASTQDNVGFLVPANGTIKNLRCRTNSAQSGTGALVVTLERSTNSGSSYSPVLTVTFAAGGAAGIQTDTTSVSVSQNDLLTFKAANAATATSARLTTCTVELQ